MVRGHGFLSRSRAPSHAPSPSAASALLPPVSHRFLSMWRISLISSTSRSVMVGLLVSVCVFARSEGVSKNPFKKNQPRRREKNETHPPRRRTSGGPCQRGAQRSRGRRPCARGSRAELPQAQAQAPPCPRPRARRARAGGLVLLLMLLVGVLPPRRGARAGQQARPPSPVPGPGGPAGRAPAACLLWGSGAAGVCPGGNGEFFVSTKRRVWLARVRRARVRHTQTRARGGKW